MRGLDNLVRWRMQGITPEVVRIDLDSPYWAPSEHVVVEDKDRMSTMDLRAVQGLVVLVSGTNPSKTQAVAELCESMGAQRVIVTVGQLSRGRHQVIEIKDTDGILVWRSDTANKNAQEGP